MSKLTDHSLPCPHPECNSSDAFSKYSDGHGYCFSCLRYFSPDRTDNNIGKYQEKPELNNQRIPYRGITAKTMEAYGVQTLVKPDGEPEAVAYPYPDGSIKIKYFEPFINHKGKEQRYKTIGNAEPCLLGMDKHTPGGAIACTITEGEDDMLSVYQMLDGNYPVFSVKSSASALKDCQAHQQDLNKFAKIYLCLDNDEHGHKAAKEIATLFDLNKVYFVDMGIFKDANEMLTKGKKKEFCKIWRFAEKYKPKGVMNTFEEIDKALNSKDSEVLASWPWPTLQSMTYGIKRGGIILITAETGVAKTTIVRAVEHHLLTTTSLTLGSIHIEETDKEQIEKLVGYDIEVPIHLEQNKMSSDEVLKHYKNMVDDNEERIFFYSHFGSQDPTILLDTIRYLVSVRSCDVVVLDHISMVVSGIDTDDERKALDIIMTGLTSMVKDLGFTLIVVSHVNKDGRTRGTKAIEQLCTDYIHLTRDLENPDPVIVNTTYLTVRKNRDGAKTGPAGMLFFNDNTFTVSEVPLNEQMGHLVEAPFNNVA